jgi:hypothetical protein
VSQCLLSCLVPPVCSTHLQGQTQALSPSQIAFDFLLKSSMEDWVGLIFTIKHSGNMSGGRACQSWLLQKWAEHQMPWVQNYECGERSLQGYNVQNMTGGSLFLAEGQGYHAADRLWGEDNAVCVACWLPLLWTTKNKDQDGAETLCTLHVGCVWIFGGQRISKDRQKIAT